MLRSFTTGTLSLLVAVLIHAGTSYADTACDPQFMDALDARGFAEAARENAQNENLIFKPDSVLEYGCFKAHIMKPSEDPALLLRGETIETLTKIPGEKYLDQNFQHEYLNNRFEGGAGLCDVLAKVFEAAKCMNFYNRINIDTMFDLTWYTTNDPRTEPQPCSMLPYAGLNMAVDIAYNNRTPAWTQGPYKRDDVNYIADPAKIMDEMFAPGACGTAIPTGMIVTDFNAPVSSFREKTCANPACVYVPTDYEYGACQMP